MALVHSKTSVISGPNGECCGLFCEADFAAEHEWGIRELAEVFGIPVPAGHGAVTPIEDSFARDFPHEHINMTLSACDVFLRVHADAEHAKRLHEDFLGAYRDVGRLRDLPGDGTPVAYWNSTTLCVAAQPTDREHNVVMSLYQAMRNLDFVIAVGRPPGHLSLSRGGLLLLVRSACEAANLFPPAPAGS